MAQATHSQVAPFGAVAVYQVVAFTQFLRDEFADRARARATRRALERLSDEQLFDIGLSRYNIHEITR